MKQIYTLLAGFIILGSSCSSSRNAAQTPDDIYYSPAGTKVAAGTAANNGEYYSTTPSDQYVRMRVQDPDRWSYFDDYNAYDSYYSPAGVGFGAGMGYGYPSYGFGYGLGYGFGASYGFGFYDPYMAWNSYFLWNSWYNPYFYNPYYGGGVFVYGHQAVTPAAYSRLRTFNTNSYNNGLVRNANGVSASPGSRFYRPGMSSTSNYNAGLNGGGRTVNNTGNTWYRPGSNNSGSYRPAFNNNTNSQPVRSFSPASSGGGGGGGFIRAGRH
ncbi:MAG TPA: hypothetical protein VNU72_02740 [Puia sp.]|jgi:hypothetical protein|nr:hypothetical protein [Puia sp.]